MCECCRCAAKGARSAYTRAVKVIREKFIRLKALGIEVQGHEHGSFFKVKVKVGDE